jgi:hypothetical protein
VSKEEIPADQYALRLGGNHDHFLCLVVYVIRRDFDALRKVPFKAVDFFVLFQRSLCIDGNHNG